MVTREDKIKQMLEAYAGSTGIGMICLDKDLKCLQTIPARPKSMDFQLLDFDELKAHIRQLIDVRTEFANYFETFITRHQFIYNIHILIVEHGIHCVLVTEPLTVKAVSDQEIHAMCDEMNCSVADKIKATRLVKDMPQVAWTRIHQLGAVMSQLVCSMLDPELTNHAISSVHHEGPDTAAVGAKMEHLLADPLEMYSLEFGLYKKIRDIIQSGDLKGLAAFEKNFRFGELTLPHIGDIDMLRVAKNYFIVFCTTEMYCAIEAGMRFTEMLNLAVKLISETEPMHQVTEVFNQMKLSLELFTQAVCTFQKQRHSKAMLELFSYIRAHFTEKITLQSLAAHIGLNASYLSSLINKETGMSLTDHINQVRIEASKTELLNSGLSVNEIALKVGFTYQNHFARIFKKYTGLSPLEYRERKSKKRPENIRRK